MIWCRNRKTRSPLEDTSRIFVKDMVIDMAIGVYDFEKGKTQRVRVNVTADLSHWPDEKNDDIEDTLSYHRIVEHIQSIAKLGHIHLVETFASRIADACLAEKHVTKITVRVEKLDIYEFCTPGCEIVRTR
jgi:dihydroneopterin aldolase